EVAVVDHNDRNPDPFVIVADHTALAAQPGNDHDPEPFYLSGAVVRCRAPHGPHPDDLEAGRTRTGLQVGIARVDPDAPHRDWITTPARSLWNVNILSQLDAVPSAESVGFLPPFASSQVKPLTPTL